MNFQHTLLLGLATTLPFVGSLRAAESVQDAFRRGLLAEEGVADLKVAVDAYSEAVRLTVDQRAIQATVLFRLAECQRKLGKTNDATATIRRLANEYSEQRDLLKKAGALDWINQSNAAEADRHYYALSEELATKRDALEFLSSMLQSIAPREGIRFAARVPSHYSNPELQRLITDFNTLEVRLTALNPDYGPEHPEVVRTRAIRQQIEAQFGEIKGAILDQMRAEEYHLRRQVESLEARLQMLRMEAPVGSSLAQIRVPPPSKIHGEAGNVLSQDELQKEVDGLSAELGVLHQLPDAAEQGRFLVSRHRELTTDAFRGEVGSWSTIPKTSRTNESWLHFESLVKSLIRPLEDRLQFARMELEVLQKQRAERAPWHLVIIGHVSRPGIVEVDRSQKMTVSQAVQMSGGPTDSADLKKVVVRRETQKGKLENIPVNLDRVLNQGDTSADLILLEGDQVLVPERNLKF